MSLQIPTGERNTDLTHRWGRDNTSYQVIVSSQISRASRHSIQAQSLPELENVDCGLLTLNSLTAQKLSSRWLIDSGDHSNANTAQQLLIMKSERGFWCVILHKPSEIFARMPCVVCGSLDRFLPILWECIPQIHRNISSNWSHSWLLWWNGKYLPELLETINSDIILKS